MDIVRKGMFVVIWTIGLLWNSQNSGGQSSILPLQITSPNDGATVAPGSLLTIVVLAQAGVTVSAMTIIGQEMPIPDPLSSPPFTFNVGVPNNLVGPKLVIAKGVSSAGVALQSAPITVNVVPSGPFSDIIVRPPGLFFKYSGARLGLSVSVKSNWTPLTVTGGTGYTSDNSGVATVDKQGVVTAQGVGSTTIRAQYQGLSATVAVTVRSAIRGDLTGDGVVDVNDLAELTRFLNTSATCQNDARDLNHDGKIDALDARILFTLFTNPRGTP